MGNGTSFEATFAAGIGMIGCILGACALVIALDKGSGGRPVLVYDAASIARQAEPYIAAGQTPMAVIDAAIARAVEAGAIVIDGEGVKAPPSRMFQLETFIAVGSDVGRLDDSAAFAPAGTIPMSAETIDAQHATQGNAEVTR